MSESQQHVFQTFSIIFEGFGEVALARLNNLGPDWLLVLQHVTEERSTLAFWNCRSRYKWMHVCVTLTAECFSQSECNEIYFFNVCARCWATIWGTYVAQTVPDLFRWLWSDDNYGQDCWKGACLNALGPSWSFSSLLSVFWWKESLISLVLIKRCRLLYVCAGLFQITHQHIATFQIKLK